MYWYPYYRMVNILPYYGEWTAAVRNYYAMNHFYNQQLSSPIVEPYLMTDPYANNYYGNYFES
ncbi:hypothetical protein [Bacillus sp. 165]|uniref:hypothetical protein n=1 Tax=Bacillus sp. 165 TaxID=1529117 RepID=UPI001ADA68A3|nr:hypothetical protein [Bacillus sp. 165]MBO9129766.1 hypothetical protein [Bacillus sp. 165]